MISFIKVDLDLRMRGNQNFILKNGEQSSIVDWCYW